MKSKERKAYTMVRTASTSVVGRTAGTIMCRISCQRLAPSIRAASNVSGAMPRIAARKTSALNGMTAHELTIATDISANRSS
jgi:hypothetical protein